MTVVGIAQRTRAASPPAGPGRDSPVVRCSHTLIRAGLAGGHRTAKLSLEPGHAAAAIAVPVASAVSGWAQDAGGRAAGS